MKNLAASIHARLIQRRAKTGEDFNLLLVRFTLERLLYRLSRSSHREQFILKGAMLFSIWGPTLHRATRDLDLLGFGNPSQERLADIFRQLASMEVEPDGVKFDSRSVAKVGTGFGQAMVITTAGNSNGNACGTVFHIHSAQVTSM